MVQKIAASRLLVRRDGGTSAEVTTEMIIEVTIGETIGTVEDGAEMIGGMMVGQAGTHMVVGEEITREGACILIICSHEEEEGMVDGGRGACE